MFDLLKVTKLFESLTPVERGAIIADKSVSILAKLHLLDLPGVDPVDTLARFIIGSVMADGKIREQEYLLIYPALIGVFGDTFDFARVKEELEADRAGGRALTKTAADMMAVFGGIDEGLQEDILLLTLAVVSVDGKVSFRERRYLNTLLRS